MTQTAKKRATSIEELADGADRHLSDAAAADEDEYTAQRWTSVLLDEAQFVKNRQVRGHQSVRKLSARTNSPSPARRWRTT